MRYCSRSVSSARPRCESVRRLAPTVTNTATSSRLVPAVVWPATRLTTPTWHCDAVFVAIPTSRRLGIAVRASSVNSNGTGSGFGNGSGPVGVSKWAGNDAGNAFGTLWSTAVEAEQHEQYQVAIIGDMHYKEQQDAAYVEARQQFLRVFDAQPESGRAVVQLGDVGTGPTSGSRKAFAVAKDVLDGFEVPYYLIMGNHDMEGKEFEADRDNVDAWRACFQQNQFWCADIGPCLLVGLSTERYRDNPDSHHEVHITPGQLEWFAKLLQDNPDRPVVVFTHAPPLGCGLKVITGLHVKNRCAWLNTSSEPEVFVELVKSHPNVHLWFSGHFHLSHNYANSISTVGTAAFVQTGVIGPHCCRDGYRQSRLLQVDTLGYRVLTLDHSTGATRLDLQAPWWPSEVPQPVTPEDELVCDPADGYLCTVDQCSILDSEAIRWFRIGPKYLLALQDGMLVDYHIKTLSPIGCSCLEVGDREVRLLDAEGVDVTFRQQGNGSDVATVVLLEADGSVSETISRNQYGSFFRLYQPNKWQIAKQKVLVEAATAPASATA